MNKLLACARDAQRLAESAAMLRAMFRQICTEGDYPLDVIEVVDRTLDDIDISVKAILDTSTGEGHCAGADTIDDREFLKLDSRLMSIIIESNIPTPKMKRFEAARCQYRLREYIAKGDDASNPFDHLDAVCNSYAKIAEGGNAPDETPAS